MIIMMPSIPVSQSRIGDKGTGFKMTILSSLFFLHHLLRFINMILYSYNRSFIYLVFTHSWTGNPLNKVLTCA